jgi:predicted metal-dependent enzyme (double-stranded beta helix superfamily)
MKWLIVSIAIASLLSCQSKQGGQKSDAELTAAIDRAMADARLALSEHGETDAAMKKIQAALARLATVPGLRERAKLGPLHGATTMTAGKLASDGEDKISLFVGRLAANTTTPVHDHLTWGVLHVLEGRDVYVPWQRVDAANDPHRAELRRMEPLILVSGHSTYWLGPPRDIHSQQTGPNDVWELIMTGKNVLGDGVIRHRHYFDPDSGRVTGSADR